MQPGLTRLALNAAAGEHGLFFPVDPGADASLGGMAATNASGTTTVRYGGMRRNVLALEVALANGSTVRTGTRAAKSSAGYDLTSLRRLGGNTRSHHRADGAALWDPGAPARGARGVREPRRRLPGGGRARRRRRAGRAARAPGRPDAGAVNAWGTSFAETPTLFVEVEGDDDDVRELCGAAATYESDADPTGRSRLWEARHHVLFALLAAAPGKVHKSTDVCVPVPALADSIRHARAALDARGVEASIVAHAGDGNYHVLFMLDPAEPEERRRRGAERRDGGLGARAWRHVHGRARDRAGKLEYLAREHGDLLPLMRGIKRLLDPAGILNPGKVVVG